MSSIQASLIRLATDRGREEPPARGAFFAVAGSAGHSVYDARELNKHPVASKLYDPPRMLGGTLRARWPELLALDGAGGHAGEEVSLGDEVKEE